MKRFLAMMCMVMAAGGCTSSPGTLQLPPGAKLIDVRSADEYAAGHLAGSFNIPHTEIGEKISAVAPDKSTPLYLYCRSGRRVGVAMETLSKLGYTEMTNLGGMEDAFRKTGIRKERQ